MCRYVSVYRHLHGLAACYEYNVTVGYAKLSCTNRTVGATCMLRCVSGGTVHNPVCQTNRTWSNASGCIEHDDSAYSMLPQGDDGVSSVTVVSIVSVVGLGVGAAVLVMTGRGRQLLDVTKKSALKRFGSNRRGSEAKSDQPLDNVTTESSSCTPTPASIESSLDTVEATVY